MDSSIEILRIEREDFFGIGKECIDLDELWEVFKSRGYIKKKEKLDSTESLFRRIWSAMRVSNKIKPPKAISKSQLSEAAYSALVFSRKFNLTPEEGFRVYLDIAFKQFKVYQLFKYPLIEDKIIKYYEDYNKTLHDKYPKITDELIRAYTVESLKRYGEDYFVNITDKATFIELAELVVEERINPTEHIIDGFDNWAWLGDRPNPRLFLKLQKREVKTKVRKVNLKKGFNRYD